MFFIDLVRIRYHNTNIPGIAIRVVVMKKHCQDVALATKPDEAAKISRAALINDERRAY